MKKRRPNGFDRLYRNPPKTTLGLFGIFEPERPSAFEQKLKELRIRQDQAAQHGTMLAWIRANHTRVFVPEDVLNAAGLSHIAWDGIHNFTHQVGFHHSNAYSSTRRKNK